MRPTLPETCRAAVFDPDTRALEIREFPVRATRPGEVLAQVRRSTICGSDLHTIHGRRRADGPLILGHESCGTVAQLGDGVTQDFAGRPLAVGDRITWSIAASCGHCFFCAHQLPQKCESLFKYGHQSIRADPPLNGAFAEYVFLVPGTAIFRVPDELSDHEAVLANCSLATMAAAVRELQFQAGEAVLIQGAGLVGLCAVALCAAQGARAILVTDLADQRLAQALRFGATAVCNPSQPSEKAFARLAADVAGPRGFDAAIEICGQPRVIPWGIQALRVGGRYLVAGCVFPGAVVEIDFERVTRRMVRLIGLHNYAPADLQSALQFLRGPGRAFPFGQLVGRVYPLDQIVEAVQDCAVRRDILRVAVAPDLTRSEPHEKRKA